MKSLLFFTLSLVMFLPLVKAQKIAPTLLIKEGGQGSKVWIEEVSKDKIIYLESPSSRQRRTIARKGLSFFFFTPPEFDQALADYQNGYLDEAMVAFTELQKKYEPTQSLPGNFSTLSGFYLLECIRKTGDYAALAAQLAKFQPRGLLLDTHQTQIELYALYPLVLAKDWKGLEAFYQEWSARQLTGSLRAQLEYCHGLALDGLGQSEQALLAFHKVFVVDYGASQILARQAALACFEIYEKSPKIIGVGKEAAALVSIWKESFGRGVELPAKYEAFHGDE